MLLTFWQFWKWQFSLPHKLPYFLLFILWYWYFTHVFFFGTHKIFHLGYNFLILLYFVSPLREIQYCQSAVFSLGDSWSKVYFSVKKSLAYNPPAHIPPENEQGATVQVILIWNHHHMYEFLAAENRVFFFHAKEESVGIPGVLLQG